MARRSYQLFSWFLTASLLFGAIVSSIHYHAPPTDNEVPSVTSVCSCQFHQESSSEIPAPNQEDDESECIICKLSANFHADCLQDNPSEIGIELAGFVTCDPAAISCRSIRLFQGRAPPTV